MCVGTGGHSAHTQGRFAAGAPGSSPKSGSKPGQALGKVMRPGQARRGSWGQARVTDALLVLAAAKLQDSPHSLRHVRRSLCFQSLHEALAAPCCPAWRLRPRRRKHVWTCPSRSSPGGQGAAGAPRTSPCRAEGLALPPGMGPCSLGQGQPNLPFLLHLPCPPSPGRNLSQPLGEAGQTREASELTGTHAGCAGAHGKAGPGRATAGQSGPRRPAAPSRLLWVREASLGGRPGSEVPGRGQAPGPGPHPRTLRAGRGGSEPRSHPSLPPLLLPPPSLHPHGAPSQASRAA